MLSPLRHPVGIRAIALGSFVAAAGLFAGSIALRAAPPSSPPYLGSFPDFAPGVTPQLPGDVDIALKKSLEAKSRFPLVQREFDLYSWQMFLALAWPTDNGGQSAPRLTDTSFGAPRWTLWHNSASVFQADGTTPNACAKPGPKMLALSRDLSKPVSRGLKAFSADAVASAQGNQRGTRFLGVISAVGELNAGNLGNDIKQAFTGPLIDQNGEFVFYEIMIDPNETKYLCDNGLYNINGQVAFAKANPKPRLNMPSGTSAVDDSGSFELKFAWRILKQGKDDFSRFYTMPAVVMDQGPDGRQIERKVTVGLVGMHIGHKTASSPQWIWATFEQIDNLDVDAVAHPKLSPSFTDPGCPLCAVDIQPVANAKGIYPRIPTQAWRAIPIPGDKVALNLQAQATLRAMGSIWQYYQLIDTQWPTDPGALPPGWNSGLPGAAANKSGGNPTPVMLTNVTMETYFQKGNQPACKSEELPGNLKCPVATIPVAPPVWNSILNASKTPVKPGVNTLAFITESCTGCHSSAGIYTSYNPVTKANTQSGQLTADFSWLPAQKATWKAAK